MLFDMGFTGSTQSETHGPVLRTTDLLIARLLEDIAAGHEPLFVGIDGRSGVGKSTLAAAIPTGFANAGNDACAVTVIEGDQFYAGGSAESWDRRTPPEKAAQVIDWRRQRAVLKQLRERGVAEWHPFDWQAEDWDSDIAPLAREPIVTEARSVVVLEGAYSCRPQLHDLLDLRVLLDIDRDVRRRRLLEREGEAYRSDWEARWAAAEDYYFNTVMPPDRFDLLLGSPQGQTPRTGCG